MLQFMGKIIAKVCACFVIGILQNAAVVRRQGFCRSTKGFGITVYGLYPLIYD